MESQTKKKKRNSIKSIKKDDKKEKPQNEKPEKKEKEKKEKKDKEDTKDSEKKIKVKKAKKRNSINKDNPKKEMNKLEKEFQKMELKEKKKLAKEIKDKYKEIQFYLPNPFKIDSAEIKKLTKLNKDNCSICQQNYKVNSEVLYMPCLHLYHKTCIIRWLIHNDKCPTCKASYKTEDKEKVKNNNNIHLDSEDVDDEDYFNITEDELEILNLLGIDNLEAYLKGEQDIYNDDNSEDFF